MDIRQLKAFVAVFEERNITAAAQRLFQAQPTLSVTIRQLEDELGVTLFQRLPRGVEVSEEARRLYPQACRLLAEAERVAGQFRRQAACRALTLGVDEAVGAGQLQALLRQARGAVPGLLLTLEAGCCGDLRLAPEEARCESELFLALWDEPWVLALPRGEVADPALLGRRDWVVCAAHASHQQLLPRYQELGVDLDCAQRAGTLALAAQLVAAGAGVALLPASLVESLPQLAAQPLDGATPTRRVGLCYAADALQNEAVALLLQGFRDGA